MNPNDNSEARREFQKGLDPEESRRKRQDDRLNLRKKTREQRLNKRRKTSNRQTLNPGESNNSNTSMSQSNTIPSWVKVENLQTFVQKINSNKFEEIFMGVQAIRQLLSVEDQPPIEQVFEANIVPKLLAIMEKTVPNNDSSSSDNNGNGKMSQRAQQMTKLQFEAAWAVTNIASGSDPKYTLHLVKMNAIRSFMKLSKNTKDVETADQAIWGLGNIAGDCPRLRDEVLSTGVLDYILDQLFSFPLSMKRNAVWTVSNFCRGKPSPNWEKVKGILKPLSKLLTQTKDYDIIVDILWAISFLSEDRSNPNDGDEPSIEEQQYGPSFQIDAVLQTGVVKYVIHLIEHASRMGLDAFNKMSEIRQTAHQNGTVPNIPQHIQQQLSTSDFVIAPCVRILGNIVSGTDEQTEKVVEAGFYDVIEICIEHRIRNIRKESCWALSNVVAGTQNQLNRFFDKPSLVKKVVGLALHGEINVRKEAGWCLSNAICGATFDQCEILVESRFLEAMVQLLTLHNVEKILRMAMEALDGCMNIYEKHLEESNTNGNFNEYVEKVEELGGLDRLEEIQGLDHISEDTYNQARELVAKYWSENRNNNGFNNNNNSNMNSTNNNFGNDSNMNSSDMNNNTWNDSFGMGETDNSNDNMDSMNNNTNVSNTNETWMENSNDFGGFDDGNTDRINDENVYEF